MIAWDSLFARLDVIPIAGVHLDLVVDPHIVRQPTGHRASHRVVLFLIFGQWIRSDRLKRGDEDRRSARPQIKVADSSSLALAAPSAGPLLIW
jgi:hypothetical protein